MPACTLVVTGGSRGIGAAVARRAGARGYRVVVNYLSSAEAADDVVEAVGAVGGEACAVRADVSVAADVVRLFDAATERFGPVGALVNNAGIQGGRQAVADLDDAVLEAIVRTNVLGVVYCTREAARRMAVSRGGAGGAIVNIGSLAARTGGYRLSHYAMSKAAVAGFTLAAARELAADGIRLNAVAPGVIATDQQPLDDPEWLARTERSIPVGRLGTPDDVAESVLWLLSDQAGYVVGETINVTGGR